MNAVKKELDQHFQESDTQLQADLLGVDCADRSPAHM